MFILMQCSYIILFFPYSLYPWCNKTGKYPIGHPEVITENFKSLSQYYGLIKCTVVPPPLLYHPLLPHHSGGKLLFALCRTCAETLQQTQCEHTRAERAITGTWVTIEVEKALLLGYEIVKTYEIWHYEKTSQYNKDTGEMGLFSEYIDLFLKLKQEASGWPEWVKSEAQEDEFIDNYLKENGKCDLSCYIRCHTLYRVIQVMLQHYSFIILSGILLNSDNISKNPGMRSLAKLMLNSMW